MLTIRLTRKGKKNQPFFRVVVIDKRRSAKGGRPAEVVGHIDPLTKRKSLEKDRILHWLKVGAKASPTVHNLLVSEKIIDAPKINKFKKSKKVKPAETAPVATAPVAEAPALEVKAEPAPAPEPEKVAEAPKEEPKTAPTETPADPVKPA